MKNLICICCPKGCHLTVDEDNGFTVTGNTCPRGAEYGKTEIQDPRRIVTSTVIVQGSRYERCPVKTNKAVPKKMIFDVMRTLDALVVTAPVKTGQTIVKDVCGTGADFIATKTIA